MSIIAGNRTYKYGIFWSEYLNSAVIKACLDADLYSLIYNGGTRRFASKTGNYSISFEKYADEHTRGFIIEQMDVAACRFPPIYHQIDALPIDEIRNMQKLYCEAVIWLENLRKTVVKYIEDLDTSNAAIIDSDTVVVSWVIVES